MLRVSPQKLNLVAAADPRQEGRGGAGRPGVLAQAHCRLGARRRCRAPSPTPRTTIELDVDNLVVAEAHVGKALVMKRFNPRARGRVGRIDEAVLEPHRRGSRSRSEAA